MVLQSRCQKNTYYWFEWTNWSFFKPFFEDKDFDIKYTSLNVTKNHILPLDLTLSENVESYLIIISQILLLIPQVIQM